MNSKTSFVQISDTQLVFSIDGEERSRYTARSMDEEVLIKVSYSPYQPEVSISLLPNSPFIIKDLGIGEYTFHPAT